MAKPTTTSSSTTPSKPTWTPGAWTPQRCRVWNLLTGEAQADFSLWVANESKANAGGTYAEQIRPQDQALLEQHQSTAEAA